MTDTIVAPRGTRDVLSPEIRAWKIMEATAREVFCRYGYEEIRTPLLESTDLFTRGIGLETDVVGKEMYTFDDRSARSLTLRPEGTAGIVRAFVEHKLHVVPPPVKLWYQGPMFRYERPQKGRHRQFHQIGVEVFGLAEPAADAEAITLAWDFFGNLFEAVRKASRSYPHASDDSSRTAIADAQDRPLEFPDLQVHLNTLGDDQCRPAHRAALQEFFRSQADRYCEDCRRRMETNPLRVLDCKVAGCIELNLQAPRLAPCSDCQRHFESVQELLGRAGVPFVLDSKIVRGLDYYTRTVFEIVPTSAAKFGQITVCAGGRYDRLVVDLGGPATPAVGWALGQERVANLIGDALGPAMLTGARPALAIGAMIPQAVPAVFQLATQLRRRGQAIAMSMQAGKPDKHLKMAIREGADYLALIGPDELVSDEVALKDLKSRQQVCVPRDPDLLGDPAALFGPKNAADRAQQVPSTRT